MDRLGFIYEASLLKGIKVILDKEISIEDIPVGSYLVIESGKYLYLGIVSDLSYLSSINPEILISVPAPYRGRIIEEVGGGYTKNLLNIVLVARLDQGTSKADKPDTIPPYGSYIYCPSANILELFYGSPDWVEGYPLGYPKIIGRVEYLTPINIRSLIELNFGIFGKSGTGKTFLGNMIVAYAMLYNLTQEDGGIRFLIFDMHDEYSIKVLDDNRRPVADGVGVIFRDEFEIYTPDYDNHRNYNMVYLPIPLYDISIAELRYVIEPLEVRPTYIESLESFKRVIVDILEDSGIEPINSREYWALGLILSRDNIGRFIEAFNEPSDPLIDTLHGSVTRSELYRLVEAIEDRIDGIGSGALSSFKAGRRRLQNLLRLPISFKKIYRDNLSRVIDTLLSRDGRSVIISMGRYERSLHVYMPLANLIGFELNRRLQEMIHEDTLDGPNKIVIMLEEAHKFLGRDVSRYNPFGIIAREMRKRGVIVVPIDQKPGDIDPDVLSMLWTFIIFALTDKRDVESTLIGLDNPELYKNIVYSLRRGEALIYGNAVRFPVILKVLEYSKIYNDLRSKYSDTIIKRNRESLYDRDIGGDD